MSSPRHAMKRGVASTEEWIKRRDELQRELETCGGRGFERRREALQHAIEGHLQKKPPPIFFHLETVFDKLMGRGWLAFPRGWFKHASDLLFPDDDGTIVNSYTDAITVHYEYQHSGYVQFHRGVAQATFSKDKTVDGKASLDSIPIDAWLDWCEFTMLLDNDIDTGMSDSDNDLNDDDLWYWGKKEIDVDCVRLRMDEVVTFER